MKDGVVLPRVGEVLDLAPDEWSYLDGRRYVVPADCAARLRVDAVDAAGARDYGYLRCWVVAHVVDEHGQPVQPVRVLDAQVPLRTGGAHGEQ